jgi:hypothetical protein
VECCSPWLWHHTTSPQRRNPRQHSVWHKSAPAKTAKREDLLNASMEVAVLLRASRFLSGGLFRVLVVMAFRVLVG